MGPTDDRLSTTEDQSAELTFDFSEAARILFSAGGVTDTLARVAELAITTIEGCDYAGLFLTEGGVVTTPVHTDEIVNRVDSLQHLTGEGPCLDAIDQHTMVYAEDLTTDSRWPEFGPRARSTGLRSVLALPLAANAHLGALNLYARYPDAFGVIDRARGVVLASLASLALQAAFAHDVDGRRTENLQAALSTREIIGQAQGILMERERISADEAFDILRRASQHLNMKLRQVAQDLVDTGENPDTGPAEST
jgi:hypothetical protein